MKKRITAFLLATLMLLAVLPLAAFAAPLYVDQGLAPKADNPFSAQLPTYDDNGDVTFYNNWTVGRYFFSTKKYDIYDEVSTHQSEAQYHLMLANATDYSWSSGGAMYPAGYFAMGDADGGAGTWNKDAHSLQFQYTAQYNGTIVPTFNIYNFFQGSEGSTVSHRFQLCVNGKPVWPVAGNDDEWYTYSNTYTRTSPENTINESDQVAAFHAAANLPATLEVATGDTVEFRVRRADSNNMVRISPSVKYTVIKETPSISSFNINPSEGLALNMYAELDPVLCDNIREDVEVGLYYWTKKPATVNLATARKMTGEKIAGSNLTKFVYEDISATEMTKELWVLPYSHVNGEDPYFGKMQLCSVAEYAKLAYTDANNDADTKNFVRELANYGANAEAFFGVDNEVAANDFLTGSEKDSDDKSGTDVWAQSNDGTNGAIINRASLVLTDKVGMKFVAPAVSGMTTYKLEIATKSDFSDATTVNMTKTADNKGYKGIYEIGLTDLTTTYYVRVTDGTTYGSTLTYSVESYITRICADPEDESEWYLLTSLLALGYAAEKIA